MHKLYLLVLAIFLTNTIKAQTSGFNSGPIPLCDTVTFTTFVTHNGLLGPSQPWLPYYEISNVLINITSNHPQTLKISITSPQGTTLLLSAFNGIGGVNYTNCNFTNSGNQIAAGSAPFTGNWFPQGGLFFTFNSEYTGGIWTITIIDTACSGGSTNGIPWTSGYFHGGTGNTGSNITFLSLPPWPPSSNALPSLTVYNCGNDTINLIDVVNTAYPSYNFPLPNNTACFPAVSIYYGGLNWYQNSYLATQPGQYTFNAYYCPPIYSETTCIINVVNLYGIIAGNDTTLSIECNANPIDLYNFTDTTGLTCNWYFNNAPIGIQNASAAQLPGTYQLIAESDSGCFDTVNIQLNPPPVFEFGMDQTASVCSNSLIDLTNLYNVNGYNHSWHFNANVIPPPTNINAPGIYSLIVDSAQCLDTVTVTLLNFSHPQVGNDTTIIGCNLLPFDLSQIFQTSGLTSTWSQNSNLITNPPLANYYGLYELTVTDQNGCIDTAFLTINQAPVSHLGPDTIITSCVNTTIDLTTQIIANGNNINWLYNSVPTSPPASTSNPGIYTVISSNIYGCLDSAQITLQLNPITNPGNDQTITNCNGTPVNLNAYFNVSGLVNNWTLAGVPVLNPSSTMQAGSYMLLATNGYNCTDTAFLHIINYAQPFIGPDYNFTGCTGDTLDLTSIYSTNGYTAIWYNNGTVVNSPATISATGVYQLIINSAAGCTDTAEVTFTVYPHPVINPLSGASICSGQSIDLTQIYSSPNYQTIWSMNGNPIATPFNVTTPGNYIATISNVHGCTTTAGYSVLLSPTPQLGPDQIIQICDGEEIDLYSSFSLNNLQTQWYTNQQPVVDPSSVNTSGNYQLIATNNDGCTDTVNLLLQVSPIPDAGPSVNISICTGQTINPNSYFNTSGFTVSWQQNGVPVPPPASTQASGQYQIIISNQAGCIDSSMLFIQVENGPNLGPDQNISICEGLSFNLFQTIQTSVNNTYWTCQGINVVAPQSISQSGIYQAITNDSIGCRDTMNVYLSLYPKPNAGNDSSATYCAWQSTDLATCFPINSYQNSYQYNGHPLQMPYIINQEGIYTHITIDTNGCIDSAHFERIHIDCKCDADIIVDAKCIEEKGILEVVADSAIQNIIWSIDGTNLTTTSSVEELQFTRTGQVEVIATIHLSCGTTIAKRTVTIDDCSSMCKLWIPNSFTPNNDGLNDEFSFKSMCEPEVYSLEIFNRFGQRIFYSNNPVLKWNGQHNNAIVTGIYSYRIEYKFPFNDIIVETGKVQLIP